MTIGVLERQRFADKFKAGDVTHRKKRSGPTGLACSGFLQLPPVSLKVGLRTLLSYEDCFLS